MTADARRTAPVARRAVVAESADGWGAWPPPTPGDRPLAMTSRADRAEHAVMATELEQANRTGHPPLGLCGVTVDPAPLGDAGRTVCGACRSAVTRRRTAHGARPPRRRSPWPWPALTAWYGALVRLLHRETPTPPAALLALPPAPVPSPRSPGGRHRRD